MISIRVFLTHMKIVLSFFLSILALCPVLAQMNTNEWIDLTREEIDDHFLSPVGLGVLNDPKFKWFHAHTPHFVIHFERKIFAVKVARQAEFFYEFIGQDLKSAKDQFQNRSHIFVFRDEKDWKYFLEKNPMAMEWSFSFVHGMSMYLQQADSTSSSAEVLGHEMTHLVFNRFYSGRMPVWLNEGTADWYGEFAYSAFKGIKKSKRQQFRRINTVYPVEELVSASTYPLDPRDISAFYQTSKFLVGYLQLNYPQEKFEPFLTEMLQGASTESALQKHYGIQSIAELNKAFQKFIR